MMRRSTLVATTLLVAAISAVAAVWAGVYDVAADRPHLRITAWLLETVRDRAIAARASKVQVPFAVPDAQQLQRGAGNYDGMCVSCHLAPGIESTELSRGLYPQPPALAQATRIDPARAYWVIKHGIKASGMPAWGKSMDDAAIWDLVAFLGELPRMTQAQYASHVQASSGHAHDGGDVSLPDAPSEHGYPAGPAARAVPGAAPPASAPAAHGAPGRSH